jgi:hypothetical protein
VVARGKIQIMNLARVKTVRLIQVERRCVKDLNAENKIQNI